MDLLAPPEWDLLLSAAMKNNGAEIHRLIQEDGVNPSHANRVAQSALHIATLWGNVEAVQALLEHNADVNAKNKMTGATPVHCAVQSRKGSVERRAICIRKLIDHGADVSMPDMFGKTAYEFCDGDSQSLAQLLQPKFPPLFAALEEGNLRQVKELIQGDPSIVQKTFMEQTPLCFTMDVLLAKDNDGKYRNGTTEAAEDQPPKDYPNLVEMLEVLLKAGADPNAVFKSDNLDEPAYPPLYRVCVALQKAYKDQDTERAAFLEATVKLLKQYGAEATSDLHQLLLTACRKNELDLTKLLIEIVHINPNVQGRQGMTPLQFAARSGRIDIVKYLLSQPNIDIRIQDDRGNTAMDAAKVNDKMEVVDILADFAANKSDNN